MRTIEEMEKELRYRRQCFERCDNHHSVSGQREYDEIRTLEIEIRKLRERGGVPVFGLEKQ